MQTLNAIDLNPLLTENLCLYQRQECKKVEWLSYF